MYYILYHICNEIYKDMQREKDNSETNRRQFCRCLHKYNDSYERQTHAILYQVWIIILACRKEHQRVFNSLLLVWNSEI